MDDEQRAQIARDEEIARQWEAEEQQRAIDEEQSAKIDWNDPSVIMYHAKLMKPKTITQARRNMIKYLKNQGNYKIKDFKGMSYNEIRPIFEKVWNFNNTNHVLPEPTKKKEQDKSTPIEEEVAKRPGVKRKKSIPRKSTKGSHKKQKLEEDAEREGLKEYLDVVPREYVPIDVESLSTKYPIVDWKTFIVSEKFMYYQVFKGDGSSKNYKILSEMLEDFDRQDGDLHTLFEPNTEDEILVHQPNYDVLSWTLYDHSGVHIVLMQNGIAIHMLTEKSYPLSQEMLTKMLSRILEVDHESSQAFELLRFIKSQVQK
ncbi:hypothetical protein Tco_0751602 [Tanacetum coccineum]|uniref:Uncharacterized protein n=1 Tax=Tanacetum coccineum TaxID=301880 RepID=A0ABQ4Z635_9ASTR